MKKIICRRCGQSEEFVAVKEVYVTVDIDGEGTQTAGADFANEGRGVWINCPCGHSWRTTRGLDLRVDVQ